MADTAGPRHADRGEGPLRARVARGAIVNAAFLATVNLLNIVRGVVVAAFITASQYGVWGIVAIGLGTLLVFRQAGIADRFIHQDESDQELAFQRALSLELAFAGLLLVGALVLFPGIALAYGRGELLVPGLAVALVIPALALQAPLGIFYRRLDFRRQRTLQAADPIAAFAVTMVLAAIGTGYWSLVAGSVAGAWLAAILAMRACPYRLALRFDRETTRAYFSFSWPLLTGGLVAVGMGHTMMLVGESALGLAGVGFIAFANTVSQYTMRVDQIVTGTMYPALCAVKDRTDLLREAFVKSNRLAVLWGFPVGLGMALFAAPFIEHVIGREWQPAVVLLQAMGVAAAFHQLGFNWDAFYRARGETRPMAWASAIAAGAFLIGPLPLLIAFDLEGLAAGMLVMEAVTLFARWVYVRRLFPGLDFVRHAMRAATPTLPAVAAVLLVRALDPGDGPALQALGEAVLFVAVALATTMRLERTLLQEALGYLRRERGATAGAAA